MSTARWCRPGCGGVGAAGLQSAPAQGAELLPDHRLRGAERADAARAESAGQRPRRQGVARLPARAVRAAAAALGGGTRCWNSAWMGPFSAAMCSRCWRRSGAEYAIKVPFYPWAGLKALVQAQRAVDAGERDRELRRAASRSHPWQRTLRVVIYRTRVQHETARTSSSISSIPATGTTSTPPS